MGTGLVFATNIFEHIIYLPNIRFRIFFNNIEQPRQDHTVLCNWIKRTILKMVIYYLIKVVRM